MQKHLDNVVQNLDSVKNGTTIEHTEYQQILMKQLKSKTQQLKESKKQIIILNSTQTNIKEQYLIFY